MSVGSPVHVRGSGAGRWRSAGALLLALGTIGSLLWWLRARIDPGRPVELALDVPSKTDILHPGGPVVVRGLVRGARGPVFCNGRKAATANGRFYVEVDGPTGAGLFIIDCHAKNDHGTTYHVRHGRLAGWTASMSSPILRAVTMNIPLSLLNDKGGVLDEMNRIVSRHILPLLTTKGSLAIGPYRLGPLWVSDVHVESLTTKVSGRIDFHLVLRRPCIEIGSRFGSPSRICLPISFRTKVGLSLSPDGRLVLHMGGIDTERIQSSPWLAGIDLAAAAARMLSDKLGRVVGWPSGRARVLARALSQAKNLLDERLSALARMIPVVPAGWSGAGSRLCLDVSLSALDTDPGRDMATISASIRILGYDPRGKCNVVQAFPKGAWRLISGGVNEAGRTTVPAGREAELVLSSDFVNAYLSGLWWMGAFGQVSLETTGESRLGFALESVTLGLPPAFLPGRYLHLALPEVGVWVNTLGEPKRYFVVSASVELKLLLSSAGLELAVMDSPLPLVALRCEGELGRSTCVEQTQRYQNMANLVLEMVRSGRLVLPILPVAQALPVWRTKFVRLQPAWVRRRTDGIGIGLDVAANGDAQSRYANQQSVQSAPVGSFFAVP